MAHTIADPIDAWLEREVKAGRLAAKPTIDQLSQVARILADTNGTNANGHSKLAGFKNGEKRRLAKKIDPRRLAG